MGPGLLSAWRSLWCWRVFPITFSFSEVRWFWPKTGRRSMMNIEHLQQGWQKEKKRAEWTSNMVPMFYGTAQRSEARPLSTHGAWSSISLEKFVMLKCFPYHLFFLWSSLILAEDWPMFNDEHRASTARLAEREEKSRVNIKHGHSFRKG